MTSDGNTIYFISERPEGQGQGDIYVSTKKGDSGWSHPKNIGEFVNTEQDEKTLETFKTTFQSEVGNYLKEQNESFVLYKYTNIGKSF